MSHAVKLKARIKKAYALAVAEWLFSKNGLPNAKAVIKDKNKVNRFPGLDRQGEIVFAIDIEPTMVEGLWVNTIVFCDNGDGTISPVIDPRGMSGDEDSAEFKKVKERLEKALGPILARISSQVDIESAKRAPKTAVTVTTGNVSYPSANTAVQQGFLEIEEDATPEQIAAAIAAFKRVR
jgi:hypothetical protein